MPILIRPATRADIAGMHRVRLAVRENRLTSSAITPAHYRPAIEDTGKGWVAERTGQIDGFAIGNRETGNIWALFVDPHAEGMGLGQSLHAAMTSWLFAQGIERLWLSTEPGTRAQRFYERAGWRFVRTLADGEVMYELMKPAAQAPLGQAAAPASLAPHSGVPLTRPCTPAGASR